MYRTRPLAKQLCHQWQLNSRRFASTTASTIKTASRQQQGQHSWNPTLTWTSVAGMATAVSYFTWMSTTVYSEAQTPVYAGAVEDPSTHILFPMYLNTNADWKRLVGLGVRQVSFLNINVYVLGLYMRSEDIGELQTNSKWKHFDKAQFLEQEELALSLLDQPVDVSIRIVPVRNTNTQHLRDGFTRSLLQRMRAQSKTMTEDEEKEIMDAIRDFKTKFVNAKVKKDTEFVFTKTRKGEFKMEYEGKDMGTVDNKWLAINFIMTYLTPDTPASEDALQNIATGFDNLMNAPTKAA
ncbi:chalcone-flavanone isomerase-domain-containing protein [Absidia repens]|uniref:Chalcone-flavanone isomerase-domain-containing protein n=1 Tax=Absidia repens TaxID=90262 RepID=A0A1X2IGS9_9FUNG|nr:chalcone-flavanone isomerase-domain-containing protein [Absidia repens]